MRLRWDSGFYRRLVPPSRLLAGAAETRIAAPGRHHCRPSWSASAFALCLHAVTSVTEIIAVREYYVLAPRSGGDHGNPHRSSSKSVGLFQKVGTSAL